ncbi:MAG: hypothetical protein K2M30_00040 [Desulfovibrionaceae bacterium]|nr:hypothetical protein [Desulfovibrionaceae bacterium]
MKTKHKVRAIQETEPKKEKPRKKKGFFSTLSSLISGVSTENEHATWLSTYTKIPKESFYILPPLHLRIICERIDPIVVETLLYNKTPGNQKIILQELYSSVLAGFKPVCRVGDNKNNAPVQKEHLIAMVYNLKKHSPPPFVIGHPENNFPAFGYIDKLKIIGDYLFAHYTDVPLQLIELINDGFFNYVSISMSVPVYKQDIRFTKLQHVGLCGGVPPAVTKLGYLRFYDGDIPTLRDGLNPAQKEVIGMSFSSIPYFKKSPLSEAGYQLIETAPYPLRVDKALRPYYSLLLQSVSKQELPLVFATPHVEDPPALGYVGSMSIKNNTIYTTFINIPEMVEGFVLEVLETHDLQLICALQKKTRKI